MAAAHDRQWVVKTFVKPKDSEPAPEDSPTTSIQRSSTFPTTQQRKPFIPGLPSNPRPVRRPSQDVRNLLQDPQISPNCRASSIAQGGLTRLPSISRSPSIRLATQVPPLPSSTPKTSTDTGDAVQNPPQDPRISPKIRASSHVQVGLPRLPSISKPSKTSRRPSMRLATQVPQLPISIPEIPTVAEDAPPPSPLRKEIESAITQSPKLVESPQKVISESEDLNSQMQDAFYLREISTHQQRSSETMPRSFSLEEVINQKDVDISPIPMNMAPMSLFQFTGPISPASPPSSGGESEPMSPLTTFSKSEQDLQPTPLNIKPQLSPDEVNLQPSTPTAPTAPLRPPQENAVPVVPEFESAPIPPHPNVSSPNSGYLIPRSLVTHLLSLDDTPRKFYLATHSPFLGSVSTSKASTTLLSAYLTDERLYLHSTLRLLCLLLANVVLPTKQSGLISKLRGGLREKMRKEEEQAECERAQTRAENIGSRLGNSLSSEVATATAILGTSTASTEVVGTEVETKTSSGVARVTFSSLGQALADTPEGEERMDEVIENVHKDVGDRTVDFLVAAIARTRKKLNLFEELSEDMIGINLDASSAEAGDASAMAAMTMFTRLFGDMGGAIEKRERSVLAGLVILYAREKVNLESWLEVKATVSSRPQLHSSSVSLSQKRKSEPDKGAVRIYLLHRLTDDETISFVDKLGKLVDDLWADKYVDKYGKFTERRDNGKKGKKGESGIWEEDIRGFEGLFKMVLDIQARFWPELR